jgi:pimeloyl-ACP methyl ester carboxylesterase
LAAGGWGGLTSLLVRSGLPGTFGEADLERYRRAWAQPGALTAMLNWYRAAGRYRGEMAALGRVQPACLILWGARDVALGRELARLSLEMCRDGRLVVFEQASHWVQHDAADEVNRQLLAFLRA